jgi:hypothetical protein
MWRQRMSTALVPCRARPSGRSALRRSSVRSRSRPTSEPGSRSSARCAPPCLAVSARRARRSLRRGAVRYLLRRAAARFGLHGERARGCAAVRRRHRPPSRLLPGRSDEPGRGSRVRQVERSPATPRPCRCGSCTSPKTPRCSHRRVGSRRRERSSSAARAPPMSRGSPSSRRRTSRRCWPDWTRRGCGSTRSRASRLP